MRDATVTTRSATLHELAPEATPAAREFSWTVETSAPWDNYIASISHRLRGYEITASGESHVQFTRLLPGDEYVLRIEKAPAHGEVKAVLRAMPR